MWRGLRVGLLSVLAFGGEAAAQVSTPQKEGDWWTRASVFTTKHYALKSDIADADLKILATHMDNTFESYMALFSQLPIRLQRPARLYLYLFADQQDYLTVLPAHFGVPGAGSWGMCISRGPEISLVGYRPREMKTVEQMKPLLQHEGFHQVARHLFSGLPMWADEGMAEFFERGVMVGSTLALGECSEHDKKYLLEAMQGNRIQPFDRFFAIDNAHWNEVVRTSKSHEAQDMYFQAWSMVHYFTFTENCKYYRNFLAFLVQLNTPRADWKRAFVNAFGTPDFRAIEQRWQEYVKSIPTTNYRETTWRLEFLAAGMSKLHSQDVHPASFDELKSKLQEIQFEHTSSLFSQSRPMKASDERLFAPPGSAEPKPKFVLADGRGRPIDESQPRRDTKALSIVSTGLEPQIFIARPLARSRQLEYTFAVERAKTAESKGTRKPAGSKQAEASRRSP